ncbi:alpha/beta fold hydrolase [uncultured Cellulomonas sp.]|uniref:alpha/beta fold hydrolase n=1 Tax=uncultured Cellulomonas sp. TaxID=189682 RepID=UPI0026151747|nr:alpha/beta hydrolase [uncultured Cellulomonas sp.]
MHGFGARSDEFIHQRAELARDHRVVSFDHRGHGRSGWAGRGSASVARLGRDLADVVERSAGDVVLVAHSMGGMAVMAMACQRADLLRSTVVAVALLSTSAGHLADSRLPDAVARALVRAGAARALFVVDWVLAPLVDAVHPFRHRWGRRWLRRHLFGRRPPTPAELDRVVDMWDSTPRSVTAAFYPSLLEHHRRAALQLLAQVPCLVLTGTDDATIPASHSERIAEALGARSRLVRVPGAGHMVNLTHPELVNAEIRDLVTRACGYRATSEDGHGPGAAGTSPRRDGADESTWRVAARPRFPAERAAEGAR